MATIINTYIMRTILFQKYCFEKKLLYVASECGRFNADMPVYDDRRDSLIEIEIKTSISDFRADFRKDKHYYYNDSEVPTDIIMSYRHKMHKNSFWKPDYFLFCVEESLTEKALEEDSFVDDQSRFTEFDYLPEGLF